MTKPTAAQVRVLGLIADGHVAATFTQYPGDPRPVLDYAITANRVQTATLTALRTNGWVKRYTSNDFYKLGGWALDNGVEQYIAPVELTADGKRIVTSARAKGNSDA